MHASPRLAAAFVIAAAVLLAALVPTAVGAPPRVASTKIVLGQSIGGVALGQFFTAARAAWGSGRCEPAYTGGPIANGGGGARRPGSEPAPSSSRLDPKEGQDCTYTYKGEPDRFGRSRGSAVFTTGHGAVNCNEDGSQCQPQEEGRVARIAIYAGSGKPGLRSPLGKPRFARPFTRFRTARGIKLGSSLKALRRTYPEASRRRDFFEADVGFSRHSHYLIAGAAANTAFNVEGGRVVGIIIVARLADEEE